ncbi:acetyl-CoA hydrolase/transferase family protein [Actinomadura flavalba]|uniref:acetyl-CoA hydrolase/transferase family protein n=1 Tax=Actinomadura flavalba TaxID=1120938 RepID=UPI00036E827A|nr:acetyl-CoA hydrolase/transferase C-terminal domain-containing protein [Actinomadura flavalba]
MRVVTEARLAAVLAGLPGNPRVVAGGNFGTPWRTLGLLDATVAEYRLFMLNAQDGVPDRDGVVLETPFVGPGMRRRKRLRYLPCRLSLVPLLLTGTLPPDVVVVQTSPPVDGTVSLGVEVNILPAAIEAVRARGGVVIAETNPHMPYTYGDAVLPVDDIDYAIEGGDPLPSPAPREPGAVAHRIGERVAGLVPEAATLQIGIGAIPDAVLASLADRRGLAVWSEMFSDGVLALEKSGTLDPGTPIVASFAFGTAELYAWMDRSDRVRMLRTEKTNDPALIARHPRLVSVNSAVQVDLFAQANAARVRGAVHSGFGGQSDFVVGALHSRGGRAIIALPSWHPRADVSTIVARLDGPATSFQHSYIVSEQGTAAVWGQDTLSQAAQLVEQVAHPDARPRLREQARTLGLPLD